MNFSKKISDIEQNHLLRLRRIANSAQGTEMKIDGKKILNTLAVLPSFLLVKLR
jgi:8-amino-7-oxononanoate synthase